MKKIIALCTSLLLAAALTGCGNSSTDNSSTSPTSSSSESSKDKSQETEKVIVDPFDKVAYHIPEFEINGVGEQEEKIYPNDLAIILDASESPFGDNMTFTYSVESADQNEIIIKARANTDEIEDFLEESNYKVEETEKTFSIATADLKTQLISSNLITDDNKKKIIETMTDCIQSDTENTDGTSEYTIEKLYIKIPEASTQFGVAEKELNSSIYLDKDSFENKYVNKAKINFQGALCFGIFGIFKDSENNYYSVSEYEIPVRFTQGIVDEDSLSFNKIPYIDVQPNPDYKFPDEKSAYDKLISVHDYENRAFSSENYIIEEIPID